MKLGVFTVLFGEKSFEEMLDYVSDAGLEAVEIGTGGNPGDAHAKIDQLLASEAEREAYLAKVKERGLIISAFSCHDNPIAPNADHAKSSDEILRKTIKLASLMGVPVVNTFSGIAGDSDN